MKALKRLNKMDKEKLIKAQRDYIEFLGKELGKHEAMIVVRPYMAHSKEVIEKGQLLRDEIKKYE